ncbi:MAG: helix-turn-helix domain-containing protein [Tissierellia bacterium]|nr:helix-turn-helix domain-containing protein [Tissierellia bacterium]
MLITHTEIPIYNIAHNVGFSNLGFFYKKFREHFKINPQEYRNGFFQK